MNICMCRFSGLIKGFCVLSFSLATAPRLFTKDLAPLLAMLRSQGISVVRYLDDLLLKDWSGSVLRQNVTLAVQFLEHLGWVLKLKKAAPYAWFRA